jgi:ribosomal protein S18 acetylase RimI-like enzyme
MIEEIIRPATLADIPYIDHLRKKNSNAVGFIPIQRYEMEINRERHGSILVCAVNNDLVGFLYATHNDRGETRIQQIAIQEDARRLERGRSMVEAVTRPLDHLLSCRCAADLESVSFWEAIGFQFAEIVPPKSVYGKGKEKTTLKSQRTIYRFQQDRTVTVRTSNV